MYKEDMTEIFIEEYVKYRLKDGVHILVYDSDGNSYGDYKEIKKRERKVIEGVIVGIIFAVKKEKVEMGEALRTGYCILDYYSRRILKNNIDVKTQVYLVVKGYFEEYDVLSLRERWKKFWAERRNGGDKKDGEERENVCE